MSYKDNQYNSFLTTSYDNEHQQTFEQQQLQQQRQEQQEQEQDSLQLHTQQDQRFQKRKTMQNNNQQTRLYQPTPLQQSQPITIETTPTSNSQHYKHTSASRCPQTQDDNQSVTSNSTEPHQSPNSMQLLNNKIDFEPQQSNSQQQQYNVKLEDNSCFAYNPTPGSESLLKIGQQNNLDDGSHNHRCSDFPVDFDFGLNPSFPQYMTNGRAKALSLPSSTSISNEYNASNLIYPELPSNTEYVDDTNVASFGNATTDAATIINYNQLETDLPMQGNEFQQQNFMGNGTLLFRPIGMVRHSYESTMVENNGMMGGPQQQPQSQPQQQSLQSQSSQRVSPRTPLGSPLTVQTTPANNSICSQMNGELMTSIDATMTSINNGTQQPGDLSSNGSLDEDSNNSFQAHTPIGGLNMSNSSVSSASVLSSVQPNGIATMTKSRLQNFRPRSKSPSLSPLTNELKQLPTTPSAQPPVSRTTSINRQKRRKLPKSNGSGIVVKQEADTMESSSLSFMPSQVTPDPTPAASTTTSSSFATALATSTASNASILRRSHSGRPRVKSAHNVIEQRYRNKINNKFNALQESVPALKVLLLRKLQEKQRLRLQRQNGELYDPTTYNGEGAGAPGEDSLSDNDDMNSTYDGIDMSILDDKEIENIDLEGLEPARKLNKGTILAKSIEYIKFLELKNERLKSDHEALLNKAKMLGVNFDDGDSNMG
ncbi:hypothetical protein CANMA_002745 [Candida margitis]|uniref:uncharacterized protein n=1 Tax=Candida margitis TaxID=1775924 RepID=UPI0022271496|nr:uncharacterized protein CANMA_002745 [Candida margitis]KAI5967977.1 hypothetical protein CANMA_002745 [Candida margitis]